MKRLKNFFKHTVALVLLVSLLTGNNLFSQPGHDKFHQEKKEKIKAQKVAFITNKLDLSPETAQVFWPVYNEAEAIKEKEMMSFRDNIDIKNIDLDILSDEEIIKLADAYILHHEKMNDINKTYHVKYKSILSPKQVVLLYESEKEFKFVLLKQVRDHKRPPDKR